MHAPCVYLGRGEKCMSNTRYYIDNKDMKFFGQFSNTENLVTPSVCRAHDE